MSYQFCLLNADSGKLAKLIIYPKNGKRISLENGLTRAILKARREKVIDKVPRKFIIAGHFTRADLTTFSDFGYFKRRTGAVRKTYATTEMPLSLRLASNEGPGPLQRRDHRHDVARPRRDIARKARKSAGRAQDRPAGGVLQGQDGYYFCGIIPRCSRNTR